MKAFRYIAKSSTPPPINYIWLDGNKLKYYINGRWVEINKSTSLNNNK